MKKINEKTNKDVFDELIVVKRSGQRVNFNNYKIVVAIKNAFDNVNGNYSEKDINNIYENVLNNIENKYTQRKTINVEDIQDIIESELLKHKYMDIYDEFSNYRKRRNESRLAFTAKQQHKFARAMEKIIDENLIRSENILTSKDIILDYGHTVLNEFVKSYVIDNKYLRMHEEGNIYIGNIGFPSLGCVSHTNLDLENIFDNESDFLNIINYLINSKEEIYGEIHITNLDLLLSNWFIKKYKLIIKEILENYINITGYSGYINSNILYNIIDKLDDLPNKDIFNNLSLNDRVKDIFNIAYEDSLKYLKKLIYDNIINMFKKLNETSKDYSFSIGNSKKCLEKLIANIIIDIVKENNLYKHISMIYKLNDIDDENLNDLFELTKENKNILFINENKIDANLEYFSNGIKIFNNINDDDYSCGRMVIADTSVNMARLGFIFKDQNRDLFYKKLEEILDLVKNELLLMFETIGNKNKDNYNYLFNDNIRYDEKLESGGKIRKVIKNSTLLIGLVGLKECVELLEKDVEKQYTLLEEIVKFVNLKCSIYCDDTKLNFNCYEPSLDVSSTYFMALDKSIYGSVKDITDKNKYELFSSLKIFQNNYKLIGNIQKYFTGGSIVLKNIKNNITYKKFVYLIEEFLQSETELIRFIRSCK